MNAEEFREVAKQIRDYANAATTGDEPKPGRYWFVDEEVEGLCWNVIAEDEGSYILEGLTDPAVAHHTASWSPGIAHIVADWLDESARQMAFTNDGARVDLRFVAIAERFAKAWRGES